MALHRCPECRKKISESATLCPHCGFSFDAANLEIYKQKVEERLLHNHQLTQQKVIIQPGGVPVFALVIGFAAWWKN